MFNHKYPLDSRGKDGFRTLKKGDFIEISPDCSLRSYDGWTRVIVVAGIPPGNKRLRTISVRCVRTGRMAPRLNVKDVMNIYEPLPKKADHPRWTKDGSLPPHRNDIARITLCEYLIAKADYDALEAGDPNGNDSRQATWGALLDAKNYWHQRLLDSLDMDHYLYGRT